MRRASTLILIKSIFVLYFAITGVLSCSKQTPASRFIANIKIAEDDQVVLQGDIFVDGLRYRMNLSQEGERIGIIVDLEKDRTWLLMPANKSCTWIDRDDPENIASDPFLGLNYLKSKCGSVRTGEAKISGYDCIEYAINDGDTTLMNYWESPVLRFPLKIVEHSNTEIVTELSVIVEGPIDEELFTIPGDYTILAQRWSAN